MASAFSHAIVALALGNAPQHSIMTWQVITLGMFCSIVPDLDVVGFPFGIQYEDLWGHRGMTHSLLFAALFSATLLGIGFRQEPIRVKIGLFLYLFLCTASHGLLDAMTNGGLGVAFFSPFDTTRYFFSWRPVLVSPIGISEFFNWYGFRVLASEALWIWLPSCAFYLLLKMGLRYAVPSHPNPSGRTTPPPKFTSC